MQPTPMRTYNATSKLEALLLERTNRKLMYAPIEKAGIIEVPDFPTMGKLVALRFLEWLQLNPEGVVSLPTGKTPEHFIKWTQRFLQEWDRKEIQQELGGWGLDTARRPRMDAVRFVQIDEFYPMNPAHENGFGHYIKRFYLEGFGLDPKRALLMDTWTVGAPAGKDLDWVFPSGKIDLTLRYRAPRNETEQLQAQAITAADQAAMEFEAKIQELGGLGFFLGGIGPDGHIGFNIRGSDHFSTTRLSPINYETAAASATDLGGIEVARDKVVITVGLKTITINPTVTAIVMAAGESKAKVIREAIENPVSVSYPATCLQTVPGGRFYLTRGASSQLIERRRLNLQAHGELPEPERERILIDIAHQTNKRLQDLTVQDVKKDRLGDFLPQDAKGLKTLADNVAARIKERIERGVRNIEGVTFLHTGPHHDDIMLGYLPYIVHLVRSPKNKHYFATLTSGFTSVTNAYVLSLFDKLERALARGVLTLEHLRPDYEPGNLQEKNEDIYLHLDGVAANSQETKDEAEARRLLRNLVELTGKLTAADVRAEFERLQAYLRSRYPGQKDTKEVQRLKGMVREWEEELTWAHLGFSSEHVPHLRLGFYTGDIFTPQPEMQRDVEPILKLLKDTKPDILTVTLDPEGAGPDTHYKVLQATSEALKLYLQEFPDRKVEVWGYRNVWYRFHPAEANVYVPVSMNSLSTMRSAFNTCYGSQRAASFPSYEYDGPFCDLAQRVMVSQCSILQHCMGREYFYDNPVPRMRASRGMNFLVAMEPQEFFNRTRALRKLTEA